MKDKSFVCFKPLEKDNGIKVLVYQLENGKTKDFYTSYTFFETLEDYKQALNLALFGDAKIDNSLHMIQLDNHINYSYDFAKLEASYNQENGYTVVY